MTNHHDEMRVAPDPALAEELRQRLHARLAGGAREPVASVEDDGISLPPAGADTDADDPLAPVLTLETDGPTGHQHRTPGRRSPSRWLLVAAAAAVLAVGGTVFVVATGDDEDPVDTVAPPTSAPPLLQDVLAIPGMSEGFPDLPPGGYFIDPDGDDTTPLRVTYDVAAEGWRAWFGAVKFTQPWVTMLTITTVTNVVTDGCLDQTPLEPPVGPTVDDLATALTQLEPFEVTAPPTDVTVFGYPGKHLELTVPASGLSGCDGYELHSWISPVNGGSFSGYDRAGQTEEFWILDVEGTRLVLVKFDDPDTPAAAVAERDAIFDSIRIEP